MVETVKFNVGGKLYECSRDLIANQNPETMLGRLVSEVWQSDPEEAIFIDRDGDLFAHVLNYLRYGSLELPVTVPKSMFERELDYYGVTVEKESITAVTPTAYLESLTIERRLAKKKLQAAEEDQYAFLLAMESHRQFLLAQNGIRSKDYIQIQRKDDLYKEGHSFSSDGLDLFGKYLREFFGLERDKSRHFLNEYGEPTYPPNLGGLKFLVKKKET